jgi:hypothetical protein
MLTTTLLVWYALGVACIGFECKYGSRRLLTLCGAIAIVIFYPFFILVISGILLATADAIIEAPWLEIRPLLIALGAIVGIVITVVLAIFIHVNYSCPIIWRRK